MNATRRNPLVFFVVFLLLAVSVGLVADTIDVLVVHSQGPDLPWTESFQDGLRRLQHRRTDVRLFIEYLDTVRTAAAIDDNDWVEYFTKKYHYVGLDAVIADSAEAVEIVGNRPGLFGGIPQVLYTAGGVDTARNQFATTPQTEFAIAETVRIALRQNPRAGKAIVIDGVVADNASVVPNLYPLLREAGLEVETYRDFSIVDLERAVRNADDETIVFSSLVFRDNTGAEFIPQNVVRRLSTVSAAPIYSFWSTMAGNGAVGGEMIDGEATGRALLHVALKYIDDGAFGTVPRTTQQYIDWELAERYGIDTGSIPPTVTILNRSQPFYVTHSRAIAVTAISIVVAFLSVILYLLLRVRRGYRNLHAQSVERERLLRERETLSAELNHRVKNNLAMVSSLIRLKDSELGDAVDLRDLQSRVDAITSLHAQLQESLHLDRVDLREYLERVVRSTFAAAPTNIVASIDVPALEIPTRQATVIGLIVSELATNALKHAFSESLSGRFRVGLSRDAANDTIIVANDGRPIPENVTMDNQESLGLQLVGMLSDQLDGHVRIERTPETRFIISYPSPRIEM